MDGCGKRGNINLIGTSTKSPPSRPEHKSHHNSSSSGENTINLITTVSVRLTVHLTRRSFTRLTHFLQVRI